MVGYEEAWTIPEITLRHVYEEHQDLIEVLKVKDIIDLRNVLKNILKNPDEVHIDRFRSNVRYYLKKIDDLWVNVVLVGNVAKTAYLISHKSYRRFKEKRW